jgi:dynein heavy chain
MGGEGKDGGDTRIKWALQRVFTILGYPRSKLEKFMQAVMADETVVRSVEKFMNNHEVPYCFFFQTNQDTVTANSQEVPVAGQLKKKVICMHRAQQECDIVADNMNDSVIFFEFPKNMLETMDKICRSVYLSMLSNVSNQKGWSDLISKDLMDKYHVFLANLHVTVGLRSGETKLPLPPREAVNVPGEERDRVHVLEGAIITWTKQIQHVLTQDPEALLKDGRHPEPLVEIDFWKNKAENLNSIHTQLGDDSLRRVLQYLEERKSTYTGPFARLQMDVARAREEANDNNRFLKALNTLFNSLTNESAEFESLSNLFGPILQMMLLIWRHSKYYNTPARLVVLIREICNSLIAHAMRYVPGPTIFQMVQGEEASEAVAMLMRTVHITSSFKRHYSKYKDLAAENGKSDGWSGINAGSAFSRLDSFLGRVKDTLDFARTVVHYLKLERVDIGGTRGKTLTATVQAIYEEFKVAVTTFQSVDYDIMDVSITKFDEDFYLFKNTVRELDRRLGSVLTSSFEDLDTIQGRVKLFDIFEGLIERPIIQEMLEKSYKKLLVQNKADLCDISRSFAENKERVNNASDDAPLYHNMPPIAGAIFWVRSLKRRAEEPMQKLLLYNQAVKSPDDEDEHLEEYHDVYTTYTALVEMLEEYEKAKYEQWESECVDSAKEKLKMRLLRRHEKTGLLKVNFDPALMRLLREVRYFLLFGLKIPPDAEEMFSRNDIYRGWMGQLDIIVEKYNAVLTELLPVEEPLLEDRIERMDTVLSPALTELRWRSEDSIPEFIQRAMTTVLDVSLVVDVLKGNLRKVSAVLSRWCQQPLLERKPKPMSPEDFETGHRALVGVKLMTMTEDGKELHKMVKDSSEALKVSKIAPTWKAYVDFVNNIVIEGYVAAIAVSMQYVCELLDPLSIARNENTQPIFDIKVELRGEDVVFDPPFFALERGTLTLRSVIDGWLRDFFAMSTMMQRLDTATGDYLNEIREHFQVQCLLSLVSELIDNTEMECMKYRQTFMENSFLWMDSIEDTFRQFLQDGACDLVADFKSEEGVPFNQIMSMIGVDLGEPIPSMDKFDKQIERFHRLKHDLSGMRTPVDIHWLRINAQPVKLALVSFAKQWEQKFTGYLHQFTDDRISSIDGFISKVMTQLTGQSPADDPENEKLLYATMTNIRDVKLAQQAMKLLFQPITEQCTLLKKHHVVVSEAQLLVLDQAPAKWQEVMRASFEEKEKILDLQKIEMGKIRNKIDKFVEEVSEFRQTFLAECPFGSENAVTRDYDASYLRLDEYHQKTLDICERARGYNNLELLFDMVQSNHRALKESDEDIVLLKNLWDNIALVKDTFLDWNSTLWDKIDTDELLMRVKDVQTQVKYLPKGMRGWKLYNWLGDEVKNMSTVLPLINDLHSDTMRDRHWTMLMATTGRSFEKGPEFCFKDLLDLNLHHYAEDVSEIVDQSAKEAKIEKKLATIRSTWSSMPVQFDCTREDCPLLADLGEIVETLEAHSLEMMGMTAQGRFIEFCQAVVDEWSGKLRTVESVLEVWQKVQTNWCRLEPIFMLSEDIRSQLPEDSKRFEQVDTKWKELMMEASSSNLIVEICCAEGREEALKEICNGIDTCEKALNEYLEQKKKAFPRFYFVANQALLDILSNGNRPKKVAAYLGDVFDGIKTLDFSKAPDTGLIASGIISKDGEIVPWQQDLTLEGAVEYYLTALEAHIRLQLLLILEQARNTADNWEVDRPREFWLEDYCAQLALVVTQILWTEETNRVFEELESGSETAMKDYKRVCDDRIEKLIKRVQTDLNKEVRVKIITIITIDVHARDVIDFFVQRRLTDASAFAWQSQLRFHWALCPPGADLVSFTPEEMKTCVIRICDCVTIYLYEYIGNCGRLVITPLTDRCYITLTQALNLNLGGAPAGPAGTGKTETTKDLSRAIGLPIVVFNCSDQMTYLTMAQIFMGLAQTGSWGCFDEFNRISIEVLSVVSTQYKSVLDAIRERVKTFIFMDEEIRLISTVGAFITMNPGYAGRTELPENLKALFRSCAMIVPDLNFICENMLMSEGFIIARPLARKFVTLYSLCKELLSKQMHYDWGLRAVKSLLRQAGQLKRKEPEADENPVLCRALRDFNTPKITTNDMPIFLRLIQDLFPGINPKPFKEPAFEKTCIDVVKRRGLQSDPGFIVKVTSLLDILMVRHCCFIIGPTGCSKTECWKSLLDALREIGQEGLWEQVNPKSITSDELYGIMTKTKEWKDGAIAVIMRNMSKEMNGYKPSHVHKWVILDGDIDATWIESMNTVMDDNKVLTLVSNERIPFTPTMRMLLEIQDMKHASPATVSRGGVLFINETDVGWKPYLESWRERMDQVAQSAFYLLFSTYFEQNMESVRKSFNFTCPMLDMAFVQSITCFVDALLNNNTKENVEALRSYSAEDQKYVYEAYFVFALMWTIGGIVADDKITNYRRSFNSWIKATSKIKFPDQGDAFDYRFEATSKEWTHWENFVQPYMPIADKMYQNIVISTVELERMKYVLDLHINRGKPVLYVGTAGTSKTTIVKDYLNEVTLKREDMMSASINHNNYTTSYALQAIMTSYLDKRTGRTYGPPGNRKCIFFIDDLNMPELDTYDTQSAIMLLCQIMSYSSIFDRARLEERKDLTDILFTACMNPKSGSFMINTRLQRQFTCLTTFAPTSEVISGIYSKILEKHLSGFTNQVQKLLEPIVFAMIDTLSAILNTPCFLPSASKFFYQFNLKDISNIFQGLLNTQQAQFREGAVKYCRVWVHEAKRVFADRLINSSDEAELQAIMEKASGKHFQGISKEELFAEPLVFTSFTSQAGGNDKVYLPIKDMAGLKKIVDDKLREYNEMYAAMNLVLFDMALMHVCRICRITDLPCGNALLVGVGGSGKQSLARLSSFINQQDVLSILVNQSYGMGELKLDLQEFYKKAAVKPGTPHAFLMTDGQIADERFLVYINDMLSSGNIPDLFAREEYDAILGNIRNAAKASGYSDDRDSLFQYFLDRVRKNLHYVLCHSPVGDSFRIRGRKFPALVSCMVIDVFQAWPRDALQGVAQRFLVELQEKGNIPTEDMVTLVSAHTAEVHLSIDAANSRFLEQ